MVLLVPQTTGICRILQEGVSKQASLNLVVFMVLVASRVIMDPLFSTPALRPRPLLLGHHSTSRSLVAMFCPRAEDIQNMAENQQHTNARRRTGSNKTETNLKKRLCAKEVARGPRRQLANHARCNWICSDVLQEVCPLCKGVRNIKDLCTIDNPSTYIVFIQFLQNVGFYEFTFFVRRAAFL